MVITLISYLGYVFFATKDSLDDKIEHAAIVLKISESNN